MSEMLSIRKSKFSLESELAGASRPGRKLLCSASAGWTSVLLQTYEQPGNVEQYESAPSPDPLVVVVLNGSYDMESFSNGSWKRARYNSNVGGLTAPHTTNRLRWHSHTAATATVSRLYIPQEYFLEANEEYRRAGERSDLAVLDKLSFTDPLLCTVMSSLGQAASRGAPDLYADASARFLAVHLLSKASHWSESKVTRTAGDELTDRRLKRVVEFMREHCSLPLTLNQLANEAAISRFHFTRLFKTRLGVTPHRHMVQLRMQKAQTLLRETGAPIGEIAGNCGYVNQGHFAAAFAKEFLESPSAFRERSKR